MTKNIISRRSILKSATAAAIAAPMINTGAFAMWAEGPAISAKAIDLVNRSLVIDMLSIMASFDQMMSSDFDENPKLHDSMKITDEQIEKIKASGINVYHPAVGISNRDDALAFVGRLNGYAAQRPDVFQRISKVADMEDAREKGRVGYIVGLQNSQHFESPDDVNVFYYLGQRVSQLTYNSQTLIGSGSTDRVDGGISDFGVAIIDRMNELGMAVDVSHCGDRTTLDAFELSKAPVLITHSNVRKLAGGHIRCKPDEAIKKMAKSGGVMGITGVRNFVSDKEPTTLEQMLDHFDYVAKLVGVEHLGVGSDMDPDGYDDISEPAYSILKNSYKDSYKFRGKIDTDGFDNPKKIYALTDGLIKRGYSDADIELILGGNFKRVFGEIWKD